MRHFRAVICLIISVAFVFLAAVIPAAVDGRGFSAPGRAKTELSGGESVTEALLSEEKTVDNTAETEKKAMFEPDTEDSLPFYETVPEEEKAETVFSADYDEEKHPAYTEITDMLAFGREYVGSFDGEGQKHIYTFTATERGYVSYNVTHPEISGFGGWRFTLYEEYFLNGSDGEKGLRELNVLKSSSAAGTDKSVDIGVMPGEYRIVAEPSYAALTPEAYSLTATFTPCTDREVECNDNIYRYTELYSSVPMHGSASYSDTRSDTDCYMLRMPTDGVIRLVFEHADMNGVSVCWRVVLYTENGDEIYSENSTLSTLKLDSGELGLAEGYYFVGVYSRVYTSCEYVLTLTRQSTTAFESELNDAADGADPVDLNKSIKGALTLKNGKPDRDMFRFDLTEPGYFSFSFTHEADAGEKRDAEQGKTVKDGWNVYLLDIGMNGIYHIISSWADEENESPYIGLGAGRYYILVDNEDLYRNTATYTLNTFFTAAANWESEPNNSFDTADTVIPGVSLTATITEYDTELDDDCFVFENTAAAPVTVVLSHPSDVTGNKIFEFVLFDESLSPVQLCAEDGQPLEEDGSPVYTCVSYGGQVVTKAHYPSLSAGKYYIRVSPGFHIENMPYTVTVENK